MKKNEEFEIKEMEEFFKKYKIHRLQDHVLDRIIYLIIASAGLIAALAWDEALHELYIHYFGEANSVLGKIVYAVFITIIAAIISLSLGRHLKKHRK